MAKQPKPRRDLSAIHSVVMGMLAAGEARPHELALVGNVSKQIISIWVSSAGLHWQERRTATVARLYATRMLNESQSKSRVR